jgi:pyruvate dehydrogenase E2 component (dihydrolipoamide acetyltransferase)
MAHMTSTRRKLAIATWAPPAEGNILGKLTLDVTRAQQYIDAVREKTGEKITITHLVGKAAGNALSQAPTLNGKILFGRFVPFDSVDVTFLVAANGDLGKSKITDVDQKDVVTIASELRSHAGRIRDGEDDAFEKSKGAIKLMPMFILRPMLKFTGWLSGALGVNIPALGVERHAFGSCIITSVGMLGFDEGYAPFTPFARVPILILVGAIKDRPVAIDGELQIRPMVTITATVDHRFIDGAQLGVLAREFREVIEDPFSLDPELRPERANAAE